MLSAGSRAYVVPTLVFLGAAYALANGLGYGCGNLRQYLLHGLHALDPAFLAGDWFTTQTRAHHTAFNALLVLVGRTMPLAPALAVANAVFACLLVICIHLLAARLYRTPIIVTSVTVLLLVFTPRPHLGMTSILTSYFQPSTIGAVGLLAGLTCLIYQRYRSAGLFFLAAGLFHINYMVWIVLIAGTVTLIHIRRIGLRSALELAIPIALAVAYHLPFVWASRSPDQLSHAAAAARILHDIYMPVHSRPMTWGAAPFIRFAAMMAAGVVALKTVPPDHRPGRTIGTILATFAAIIALGMMLTMLFPVDMVAMLFPYRLAPFLILAAQIAVAGAVVTTAQSSLLSLPKTLGLWAVLTGLLYLAGMKPYGLTCLGVFITAILAGRLAECERLSLPAMSVLLGTIAAALHYLGAGRAGLMYIGAFAVAALAWRAAQRWQSGRSHRIRLMLCGRVVMPLVIAVFVMRLGAVRKDLLGPPPSDDERLLYDWCQAHTGRDEVFVIPPQLGGFRLGAERAVVADWKCMPILPKDTVEWYRRLVAICGMDFATCQQASAGFRRLDAARAKRLARRFRADYLVTYRNRHQGDLHNLPRVYENPTFAVFKVGPTEYVSSGP